MESLRESGLITVLNAYEYITNGRYLSSFESGKENIIVYISYLLKQMGLDINYKYILDPDCGLTSRDFLFELKFFRDWDKVSLADLVISEYVNTEKIRKLSEIAKYHKETLYSLQEFLGALSTLNFIINSSCFSDRDAIEYLENNSPFIDDISNHRCMQLAREF